MAEPEKPAETSEQKATRLAGDAASAAVVAGAQTVIVMIAMRDGTYRITWGGKSMDVLRLAELGQRKIQTRLRESSNA
jgi:carbon monoxide dehydrogenase subunit G